MAPRLKASRNVAINDECHQSFAETNSYLKKKFVKRSLLTPTEDQGQGGYELWEALQ